MFSYTIGVSFFSFAITRNESKWIDFKELGNVAFAIDLQITHTSAGL